MVIKKERELIKCISNIKVAMDQIGKTDTFLTTEETSALFSIYFLDSKNNVGTNREIYKNINKLQKLFNVRNFSVGKTVSVYLEVE